MQSVSDHLDGWMSMVGIINGHCTMVRSKIYQDLYIYYLCHCSHIITKDLSTLLIFIISFEQERRHGQKQHNSEIEHQNNIPKRL